MKINILLPTLGYSGGIRVIAIYAKWLSLKGHDVVLISRAAKAPSWRSRVKNLLKLQGWIKHLDVPASHLDSLQLEHRVVPAGVNPTPRDVPPADVLISTWWETAEWAASLPQDRGARAYLIQGHEIFDFVPKLRCEATYRMPFHKIVISRWLADLMAERYGDVITDVVPNGVDHTQFFAPERSKQRKPTVGILYHEASLKGLDVALSAVNKLRSHFPCLRVVAFGSKPPTDTRLLPGYIDLHVAPPQDDLRKLYSSCDVWLTTSRSEGFNLMAMEAMACRTPVVSSRTGWPVEGIRDGVNGYLVEIDDPVAAAEAAARVLDLEDRVWQTMSANAFETVANATWESSCQKFEQALYRACERAKRSEIAGVTGSYGVC